MIQKIVDQLTDKLEESFGKLDDRLKGLQHLFEVMLEGMPGALRAQLDYQDRLLKSSHRQEVLLRELTDRAGRQERLLESIWANTKPKPAESHQVRRFFEGKEL